MQFKNLALSFLVAVAAADSVTDLVGQIPSCALTCLISSSTTVGCGVTDYSCQCEKADDLKTAAEPCVASACSTADQATALTVSGEICVALGVGSVSSTVASATSAAGSAASSISSSIASVVSSATATGTSTSATSTASPAAAGRVELGAVAMGVAALAFAL